MVPCIISNANFGGDAAIDRYVERIHDEFEGCFHSDGCGKITFIGNIVSSTEVVNSESAVKSSADWADFIKSMNNSTKKVWAIALTLVKQNRIGFYKETFYINANYSDVKVYTSPWDNYGEIHRDRDSYLSIGHFLGPVLDALEIKYK